MSPDTTPLIVEVRANEFAARTTNHHIPFGAAEMIADALACRAEGASSYHWHTRAEDGSDNPHDAQLHRDVIAGIRASSSMLLHPSLGFNATQGDARARLAMLEKVLTAEYRPDIVPIDVGAFVSDPFDPAAARFESTDAVLLNRTGYLRELAQGISALGLAVLAVVWSPGGVRTALRMREIGDITTPVYWQIGFTGTRIPGGPPATRSQLEAFLEEIPAGEPWNVHVRDGDGMEMAVEAIVRGGHVSIGLGDDPYDRFGQPTNADLVRRVAAVAEAVGRPMATPAQARALLGWD